MGTELSGKEILQKGKGANSRSHAQVLLADLKTCSRTRNLERGKQVHAEAIQCGLDSSIYIATGLINMYAKCGNMMDARSIFDTTEHPNVVSWTVLILGYADNGQGQSALDLFTRMRTEGPSPDAVTFVAALKACTSFACCKEIQNLVMEYGCYSDVYVQSTLVDMYAKCGSMPDAREVFDSMKHPNVVSWTSLILGYAGNGQGHNSLHLFSKMRSEGTAPDSVTFVAALRACTSLALKGASAWKQFKEIGNAIHDLATEYGYSSHIYVQNTLIDMYAKCASMVEAQEVFSSVKRPDVVSWNGLILGYADNGQGHTSLNLFHKMRAEGPAPNLVTFMGALKACGLVGALEFGRTIHSEINTENSLAVVLVNCLVDFYAKCGSLEEAQAIFNSHAQVRDMITWTSLLSGFSSCGDNEAVFGLFEGMQDAGFQPDGITFLCILKCCSHVGLVKKGKECFELMSSKYGIVPNLQHYTCIIDLLGRADKLDDALVLLECMPYKPDDVIWMAILDASRKWKNVEIGRLAFQSLIKLSDRNAAGYALMGQIYGSRGMLEEQEMVMGFRKKCKAWKKPPATCWTNEVGEVHTLLVEDSRHPQIHEIREKWKSLLVVMRRHGYETYETTLSQDVRAVETTVCGHSEKLALLCALINTENGKTVRIVKNFEVCDDCHTAIGLISRLERRTVICIDASKMHVFKEGKCYCRDSW